jgi:hypothetical protein
MVFGLLSAVHAQADARFDQECVANLPPTRIEVLLDTPSIKYDTSLSVAELSRKKEHGAGWQTLGLTVMSTKMEVETKGTTWRAPNGEVCMRPAIKVTVTAFPQTVYIAREFRPGTCAYQEIMAHEQRHVKVNIEHTRRAVAAFETELRQAFGNDIYFGQGSGLSTELQRAIRTGWLPNLKARLAQSSPLHAQIDTAQEYARMGYVCSGEISLILQNPSRR